MTEEDGALGSAGDASMLAERIRDRGLPEAVVELATQGGAHVHPALWFRVESVSMSTAGPAWTIVNAYGGEDLVPLWTCGTVTVFSAADGTFLEWDAEEAEPWTVWSDFAEAVRELLTDLWEDEVSDQDRAAIARLLLPAGDIAAALTPVQR